MISPPPQSRSLPTLSWHFGRGQGEGLRFCVLVFAFCILPFSSLSPAADPPTATPKPKTFIGLNTDYGPFLSYTVARDAKSPAGRDTVPKGIAIKLGQPNEAAVLFDTDTLRIASAWTGGFLDITKTHLATYKGTSPAFIQGDEKFSTKPGPGWSSTTDFSDPRPSYGGPLPRALARYRGLYLNGDNVVLSYTIAGRDILELPGLAHAANQPVFTRTFHLSKSTSASILLVAEADDSTSQFLGADGSLAILNKAESSTAAAIISAPKGAVLTLTDRQIRLRIPPLSEPAVFTLAIWTGPPADLPQFIAWHKAAPAPPDPSTLCKGGPPRWLPTLTTQGNRSADTAAYVVDTIPLPDQNPWKSWLRTAAFDFFADGRRAAVSTWNGDVWIVSGIDDTLQNLQWKRFATGLFEGLGLKIIDDQVYVLTRDKLLRLHDLNNDGEADLYECINNDGPVFPTYHDFAFELQTDSAGNFYYTRCGHHTPPAVPFHGSVLKISKDGEKLEEIATGLRAPNGLVIGPRDQIICSDNQGEWTPSSRINWVRPGGFYGYTPHAHRPTPPDDFDKPLCWIPHDIDRSSASLAFVTSDKWGPLNGQLLFTSYGNAALFLVMPQEVKGQMQAGVVQFPLTFDSGLMRARFNPIDGQLYLTGLKGFDTVAARDGVFCRVRYTGKPLYLPTALQVAADGLNISFPTPLDPPTAADANNYSIEQWNYKWSAAYGSADYSVLDPTKKRRDAVEVLSATLSPDRKTILLKTDPLKPVMQMKIQFKLKAADGAPISSSIFNTINAVPEKTSDKP